MNRMKEIGRQVLLAQRALKDMGDYGVTEEFEEAQWEALCRRFDKEHAALKSLVEPPKTGDTPTPLDDGRRPFDDGVPRWGRRRSG
jgi:hypothetical protein